MEAISFLSGNIRGWAGPDRDREHAWSYRAPLYASLLADRAPHLVGFQEFQEANLTDLQPALPFHACALGRECGIGQYVPLFWDTRRFECLRTESFWLSDSPESKAIGWDANNERAVTWAELQDLGSDRALLVINTHFDHVGEEARIRSTHLILDLVARWPIETPIIILGDFNSSPYHPIRGTLYTGRSFGLFAKAGFMDAYRSHTGVWPPPATFHDYQGEAYVPDLYGTWYIDWPLTRNLRVRTAEIVRHHQGSLPLSDHYPVYVTVTYADATW